MSLGNLLGNCGQIPHPRGKNPVQMPAHVTAADSVIKCPPPPPLPPPPPSSESRISFKLKSFPAFLCLMCASAVDMPSKHEQVSNVGFGNCRASIGTNENEPRLSPIAYELRSRKIAPLVRIIVRRIPLSYESFWGIWCKLRSREDRILWAWKFVWGQRTKQKIEIAL